MADEICQRLFFALWPTAVSQNALFHIVEPNLTLGRPVKAENLHLTLMFLGNTIPERQTCLESAAQMIHVPGFDLTFEHLVYRKRQQMLWLETQVVPDALLQLVAELNRIGELCGFVPESRPFKPHMTLMRKARRGPEETMIPPWRWPVRSFALVASETLDTGAQYRVVKTWPLGDPEDKSVE